MMMIFKIPVALSGCFPGFPDLLSVIRENAMRLVLLWSPLCRWSMESWRERKWICPGPHDEQSWEFWNSGLENFDAGRGTSPLLSMPSLDGEWSGICLLIHMTFWKRQTVKTEVRQWEEPLEEDQWLTYIGGQDELVQGSTAREI